MTKAAILIEPGKPLSIEDVVVADCGPHEVRIRTAACGLCHSDLHFIDGAYPHPLPAIPGHARRRASSRRSAAKCAR